MTRSLPEWIGRSDDDPVPNRVKVRVFTKDKWTCRNCGRRLCHGDILHCDHAIALANAGRNAEDNLQTLCSWCHIKKTKADVALKSKVYEGQKRRAGLRKRGGRVFQTNRDQPFKKKITGEVVRR